MAIRKYLQPGAKPAGFWVGVRDAVTFCLFLFFDVQSNRGVQYYLGVLVGVLLILGALYVFILMN